MTDLVQKGRALILRTCNADMTSHGGFVWPESGLVECPDWKPTKEFGNGLHGALWGEGNGSLLSFAADAKWLVAEIEEWVDLGGKVKFPRANVLHCGDQKSATDFIIANGATGAVIGASVSAGHRGTATAGDRGTATAGHEGTATAGYRGTATAGDWSTAIAGCEGTATAGDWSTAIAGCEGTAIAGDRGTATAGDEGTAIVGRWGILQIKWHDGSRHRIATAYVGESGIKPNTPYRMTSDGEFVEVEQ